jgi:hypothetical protein
MKGLAMPPLSSLLATLDAYWYVIVAVVIFLGAVWRSLPVELRDKIERSFPRLVGFVRVLIAIFPDLVNAFRAFRIQIVAGEPKRGAAPEAPAKREGFARLDVVCFVGGMLGVLAFLVSLSGCPVWERPACGSPRAYQCVGNQPHVCSPSQRLTPIGDTPCAANGAECAINDAGVAYCVGGDR